MNNNKSLNKNSHSLSNKIKTFKKPFYKLIYSFLIIIVSSSFFGCTSSGNTGGLLFSDDEGETWKFQNEQEDDKNDLAKGSVKSVAVNSANPKEIYLSLESSRYLFKSANGGKKWKKIFENKALIQSIQLDPNNSDIIYLLTEWDNQSRILKSVDQGENFKEIYVTSETDIYIADFVVNPTDSKILYMLTENTGLFRSNDAGYSWEIVHWFETNGRRLKIFPTGDSKMYVFTENAYLISNDRGQNWTDKTESYQDFSGALAVNDFVFNSSNSNEIYSASTYGLLRSRDAGETWTSVPLIIPPEAVAVMTIAVNPENSNQLMAGANDSIYKSHDKGQNWNVKQFKTSKFVNHIFYNKSESNKVYAFLGQGVETE